jgi:hypothetical protein
MTVGERKMRTLSLALILLLGTAGVASAENFTITGKGTNVSQIGGPGPMGKPIVAGVSKNETEVTWASGKKTTSKGDCMAWSAPPTSGFTAQGICSSADNEGSKTFLVFSCLSLNDKNTASDCWGRLTGLSGAWQGKTATASWRGTQNADGKGGTAVGAGTMN